MKKLLVVFGLLFVVFGCAKRGYINGGDKDLNPPVLIKTKPQNFSTYFNSKEIVLEFDEYVKLKDIQKNLTFSPPLRNRPEITPYAASKQIKIRLRDTLLSNTTYTIDFGNSIEDNNEANQLQGLKYVFSTGAYLDSLTLSGEVKPALEQEFRNRISVMLYEVTDTYRDSVIYKNKPSYVTYIQNGAYNFDFQNLKAGRYKLVALEDRNNNQLFDPNEDRIGFWNEIITLPTDQNYKMRVFKEQQDFKPVSLYEAMKNRLVVGYQGRYEEGLVALNVDNQNIQTRITKMSDRDSLNIWYRPALKTDSLILALNYNKKEQRKFAVKPKQKNKDTLELKLLSSKKLRFYQNAVFETSTPIENIRMEYIRLQNKDSVSVPLSVKYDSLNQRLEVMFEKEELQQYHLTFLPEALKDFFWRTNDTIQTEFSTGQYADYGNLRLILKNSKPYPTIVELLDAKEKVVETIYNKDSDVIEFNYLQPALYTLRIIYDANGNGRWDTGEFLRGIQPEEVIYYPEKIDVRANWDIEQVFTLKE